MNAEKKKKEKERKKEKKVENDEGTRCRYFTRTYLTAVCRGDGARVYNPLESIFKVRRRGGGGDGAGRGREGEGGGWNLIILFDLG